MDTPARSWQEITAEITNEKDPQKVSILAEELLVALAEANTEAAPDSLKKRVNPDGA